MKAEAANEKRFESVNEFRGQLSDQAQHFIPRGVFESQVGSINDRPRAVEAAILLKTGATDQQRRNGDKMQPWMLWAAGAS